MGLTQEVGDEQAGSVCTRVFISYFFVRRLISLVVPEAFGRKLLFAGQLAIYGFSRIYWHHF